VDDFVTMGKARSAFAPEAFVVGDLQNGMSFERSRGK